MVINSVLWWKLSVMWSKKEGGFVGKCSKKKLWDVFDKNVNVSAWCCYSLDRGRTLLVTPIIVGIFKITLLSDKMSVITPRDFNPKVVISCLITRNFMGISGIHILTLFGRAVGCWSLLNSDWISGSGYNCLCHIEEYFFSQGRCFVKTLMDKSALNVPKER